MTFGNPIWLYALGGVLPLLILFYIWSEQKMRARLRSFAASKLAAELTASYSPVRQRIKMVLTLLAVTCLFVALARPQYGVVLEESEARGIDLMIALDTSRSMLAEDVKPNRLERSKLAVLDLVNAMRGDRVGLLAFAGDAFLQCPLTLDYDAFRQTLEAVDTEIISRGGTDIATAIDEARAALGEDRNFKLLVLITDGEDLEASGITAAREAAEAGLRIFTVGVGSASGEPIPIRDANGEPTFLRDASGRVVRSALDEDTLKAIAAASNGFYAPLGASGGGLQAVYQQLIEELPAEELGTRMQQIPLERYQWPLAAGLFFLFLEPLIGTRRRRRPSPGKLLARTSSTLSLLFLFLCLLPAPSPAASPARGVNLYEKGRYEEAATIFEEALKESPGDARLQYNLGNAYYRLERWEDARRAFAQSLHTTDPALQANAFFNLGNALYQLGQHTEETQPGREARLALWEEALGAYRNSAALDSEEPDLAQNTELVRQAIRLLTRQLSIVIDPEGAGTAEPTGRFVAGSEIALVAEAAEGWLFREWIDAPVEDAKEAKTKLVLNEDTVATAHFVKTWKLEVQSAQPEHGTAEKSGIYPEDQPVTVTATPKEPWVFDFWEANGAEINPTDQAQAQVTLTQDATVTANFAPGFKLDVTCEPQIGGWAGPSGYFKQFTEVPVQAEVRDGFEWIGWVGPGLSDATSLQTQVDLSNDIAISAHFERQWNLIVAENDRQGGSVTGSGDFPLGTTTPITAKPNEGYKFVQWMGEGIADPTSPETEVTVNSMKHDVIAVFEADESQDQNNQDQSQNQDQQNSDQQNSDQQDQDSQDQNQENQDQENQDQENQDQEDESSESEQDQEQSPEEQEEEPQDEQDQSSEAEESQEEQEDESSQENQSQDASAAEEQPVEARQAGEMTEEEARQLLNALRESERKLPAIRRERRGQDTTGRDW